MPKPKARPSKTKIPPAKAKTVPGVSQKRLSAAQAVASAPFVDAAMLSDPDEGRLPLAEFTEISDPKKRLYLQALAEYPSYERAAIRAGVSSKTGYNWRHGLHTSRAEDGDAVAFREALHVAWRLGCEHVESEMWRRGIKGVKEPVFQGGRLVGTKRSFDTTAAIFMMKGNMPEKYREKVELTGGGGGPIQSQSTVALLTSEEVLARMQQAASVLQLAGQTLPPTIINVTPTTEAVQAADPVEVAKAAYAAELAARTGGNGNGNGSGT